MAQTTYVKGNVRKDAVAILPKDCRVTEARVLETLYGGGWVPTHLRAVEVDELPSAAAELERLTGLYGAKAVEDAYGNATQARKSITEILAMSPAQVKASGLLLENDATPVEVEGGKAKKGGKAAASADSGGESAQAAT